MKKQSVFSILMGYKDAPIILLDEATASLDVENETMIQTALSRLIKDKTALIIAHRMRTVAGADKTWFWRTESWRSRGLPTNYIRKTAFTPVWLICNRQAESGKLNNRAALRRKIRLKARTEFLIAFFKVT